MRGIVLGILLATFGLASGVQAGEAVAPMKHVPQMSFRPVPSQQMSTRAFVLPGEDNPDAQPHSCYGDVGEKDEDLNAFYPVTEQEVLYLLNGPGA